MTLEDLKQFQDLGVPLEICEPCALAGLKYPTDIQTKVIPYALRKKDVMALAQTGSGKTAGYAIPILTKLLQAESAFFACVIVPTRELAVQTCTCFNTLGSSLGVRVLSLIGGIDTIEQALQLAKKPHIIVSTPGRLLDHLQNTKGFSLADIRFLVLDEADRLMELNFYEDIESILSYCPSKGMCRMLFSATLSNDTEKLESLSLRSPIRIGLEAKYESVASLKERFCLVPLKFKECYLVHLSNLFPNCVFIIFVRSREACRKLKLILDPFFGNTLMLHGKMSQERRIRAIEEFRGQVGRIMVATDLASRGLDIPHVDVVINYDLPLGGKDYVHRVGRAARANKSGMSITFVTQYDLEQFLEIEKFLGRKLEPFQVDRAQAKRNYLQVLDAYEKARDIIRKEDGKMKEMKGKKRKHREKEEPKFRY